ncbi:LacI family DNA-binding transcriptional regulator [Kribbella italica]|uniref:LacI family transcriptional regulator n=1 Tax=Kribbella italica TaxID=1540520 RepID=A0A7W9J5B4_9ACTN|nr:LacI family DNA-binding transcriptional regulator [Kribbella italica]MBB5835674.1 LacI family transcriptional regulator [Kribbella italica]
MAPTGKRRTTLQQVARDAGVSIATASYVLAGRSKVDPRAKVGDDTERRVRESARRLHYRVNASAHATRTGRTGQVLLAMTTSYDPWVQTVVTAVSTELEEHDVQALVIPDGNWYRALQRMNPDAVFIDGLAEPGDQEHVEELVATGLRIIVLGDKLPGDGYDIIDSRATDGCRLSMRHLIGLGHRRIACLTVEPHSETRATRAAIYLDELKAAGLGVPEGFLRATGPTPIGGYQTAIDLLTLPEPPTAIFCASDYLALSVVKAAERLGVSIPGQLSVIGAGNIPDGTVSTPALTTVGATDEPGEIARLVRRRALGDESPPTRTVLDWSLIQRDSTGRPTTSGDHRSKGRTS